MSQQEVDPSEGIHGQIVYTEGDVYSQVISKEERNGRIRGLGFGPTIPRTRSSDKASYDDFIEQHMQDTHTIKTLQEKLLEKELERVAREQQFEQRMLAMQEKEKQYEERFRMLEQLIPTVNINGGSRDEVSPGLQQKSSCASHHD